MKTETFSPLPSPWVSALLTIVGLGGCGADKSGISEKASIEGVATIRAENANLATRVSAMERDLEQRRRFVDAAVGTYEGVFSDARADQGSMRVIVTSSLPRSPASDRTRTVDELAYDLNNLTLHAQVIEWTNLEPSGEVAFGCTFTEVRPNIIDGTIQLMSDTCKMSYQFFATERPAEGPLLASTRIDPGLSSTLAAHAVAGEIDNIPAFVGRKQSNLSSSRFSFRIRKVDMQ